MRRASALTLGLSACALAMGCRIADLLNTPQASPGLPQALAQARSDGTTAITTGATTNEATVVLGASVSDPDAADSVRLEVEVRPLSIAFTDSATATSAPVANGATASIAVSGLTDNLAYHWQARSVDQTGRASAWVAFGGNAEDAPDYRVDAVAEPPATPAALAQLKSDGATAIAIGAATDETTVLFQATLTDPDPGDSVRLEVERQPVGTPAFTGTPSGSSPGVTSGGTARVTLSGQLDNVSYHWQARAVDRTGLTSAWVSFGGNPEIQADYRIDIPEPPNPPTSLGQFRANGQQVIAVGDSTDQTTVVFKGTVTDPDFGDEVRLEVEVRTLDVAFAGAPTATGALVASGATARVDVLGLLTGTDYHWQARTVDQTGRASAWVPFGGNAESARDFRVR